MDMSDLTSLHGLAVLMRMEKLYQSAPTTLSVQWHKLVLENTHPMFCVWDVSGEICGFYTIVRKVFNGDDALPHYKVGLGAVKQGYRSFGAQNLMQQWLFSRAFDLKWVTVNSPALTNKAGIKNNIRARKIFDHAEVFMFANRQAMGI
jgi:hypothetical protein